MLTPKAARPARITAHRESTTACFINNASLRGLRRRFLERANLNLRRRWGRSPGVGRHTGRFIVAILTALIGSLKLNVNVHGERHPGVRCAHGVSSRCAPTSCAKWTGSRGHEEIDGRGTQASRSSSHRRQTGGVLLWRTLKTIGFPAVEPGADYRSHRRRESSPKTTPRSTRSPMTAERDLMKEPTNLG